MKNVKKLLRIIYYLKNRLNKSLNAIIGFIMLLHKNTWTMMEYFKNY